MIQCLLWPVNKVDCRKFSMDLQPRWKCRNPSLPCTTKRRIPTNLKSINNQKHQKIKLHGTLTTKELKKKSNRTTRAVRLWTTWAGLAQKNHGEVASCKGKAGWRRNWASELTVVYGSCPSGRNTQSHTRSIGKCTKDEQVSCIVPSLAPPPQAVPQHSKEGCPAPVDTYRPTPL